MIFSKNSSDFLVENKKIWFSFLSYKYDFVIFSFVFLINDLIHNYCLKWFKIILWSLLKIKNDDYLIL